MSNLPLKKEWTTGVYQIETTDPVMGGENGLSNKPIKNLGDRTEYLKQEQDNLKEFLEEAPFCPINEQNKTAIGTVVISAMSEIVSGYLECNGALVSKTTFAVLFQKIGSKWGSTSTHFRVPDLRGVFVRGYDHGRGLDSARGLGTFQAHAFQNHAHYLPTTTGNNASLESGIRSVINDTGLGSTSKGAFVPKSQLAADRQGDNAGIATATFTRTYSSHVRGGYNTADETRPDNVALMYLIRAY